MGRPEFSAAHAVLRRHHEERRLSGVSALIFQGGEVADRFCVGEADMERSLPMRPDHIHRAQSNAKLIQRYIEALRQRLFGPLGMVDTGYVLRPEQVPRLAAQYIGKLDDPSEPGLKRLDEQPSPFLTPVQRQAGAGGMFTTQSDMLALVSHLFPSRGGPLTDATLVEMSRDQLPAHLSVQFPRRGPIPAFGFGLGGAVTRRASELQANTPVGELQWGGFAGTHWAISASTGEALVLMTQRQMGFWNPFWFEWKAAACSALNSLRNAGG
jgi:CubicO group peptidase (beta-lactamase class C family)